jgi:thiol-disulfide isomerase/thioredoxin
MHRLRVVFFAALCGSSLLGAMSGCNRGTPSSEPVKAPAAETPAAETPAAETPKIAAREPEAAPAQQTPPEAPRAAQAQPESAAPGALPAKLGPIHRLSVLDLDGNTVSLAQFAGRPMIIEIWATWCGPCRLNRNTIHKLKSEFPERLLVIGVSLDAPPPGGSAAALVKDFLRSNPPNEREFLASPEFIEFVNQRATSTAIPKTMYVNGKGQVVDLSEGVQGKDWLRGMAKNLK